MQKSIVANVDDALSLHALGELGGHARVHLDGEAGLALLQDAYGQVASAGADLKHAIRRAQVSLVDDTGSVNVYPARCCRRQCPSMAR